MFCDRHREAFRYIDLAVESPNEQIKKNALYIQKKLDEKVPELWGNK